MGVRGLDIFCGLKESDPRSNVHYLSNSEKKAWIFFFFQALFLLLLK